jgi:hypothetical protein
MPTTALSTIAQRGIEERFEIDSPRRDETRRPGTVDDERE